MKRLSLILIVLISLSTTFQAETLIVDNTTRDYIVYAPKNLGSQRPLLISCHGMNQDAGYQKGMLQIEAIADTVLLLNQGKIMVSGSPAEVIEKAMAENPAIQSLEDVYLYYAEGKV